MAWTPYLYATGGVIATLTLLVPGPVVAQPEPPPPSGTYGTQTTGPRRLGPALLPPPNPTAGPPTAGPRTAGPTADPTAGPTIGQGTASPTAGPRRGWLDEATLPIQHAAASGLSLGVDDGNEKVVAGQDVTYTITAENDGEEPLSVVVRASVPLRMSDAQPSEGGHRGDGFIDWPVVLRPAGVATLELTGVYQAFPEDDQTDWTPRVAFTACALDQDQGEPILCATDVAELDTSSDLVWWLVGAAAAALAAGAGLALFRRGRPDADPMDPPRPGRPAITTPVRGDAAAGRVVGGGPER